MENGIKAQEKFYLSILSAPQKMFNVLVVLLASQALKAACLPVSGGCPSGWAPYQDSSVVSGEARKCFQVSNFMRTTVAKILAYHGGSPDTLVFFDEIMSSPLLWRIALSSLD